MITRMYGRWIPDADPKAGYKAAALRGAADSLPDMTRNR
jgi:hypothetical protein